MTQPIGQASHPANTTSTVTSVSTTWIGKKIEAEKNNSKQIWLRFGLSANPIHLGHTAYLNEVAKAISPHKVTIIPAKSNWQKDGIAQGTPQQKEEMTRAAVRQHNETPEASSH